MRLPRCLLWRTDQEFDEELQSHLEIEIQANLERGLSPNEARYAALRRFGNRTLIHERAREGAVRSMLQRLDPPTPGGSFPGRIRSASG